MAQQTYQLTVRKGPQIGQVFHLDARSLLVGRDPMCDIVINDPEISRQHARFTQLEVGYQLEDLGSTNGTFIEGERLVSEPGVLVPGQMVNMGSGVSVLYEMVEGEEEMLPEMVPTTAPLPQTVTPLPAIELYPEIIPDADTPVDEAAYVPSELEPPPAEMAYVEPAANEPGLMVQEDAPRSRRNTTIAIAAVLLLCCCCSSLAFMYQWGGDWLLDYLGLLP